ncbi:DUF4160 domain-containing protein [Geobacter sp. DSM 9736]|uniref:DUF4160 domain-containing protein n=1 Tax=Geobacter sp. DSM 9736 TaxID=1277350 RepID=UPI000B509CDF|nr:DUF4160 domain-containing protein [Geobacter sp. DSM 9736]SNB45903.1 protein of unknown function [Geobacter sp. DSM 9736]
MPVVSMFYGLIIYMYSLDSKQHHLPHIHVEYQGQECIVAIPGGEVLEGELPANKMKLLAAWIEIHQEELMADWSLATKGQPIFKIDPLR